jgi:hypothetical protein
MRDAGRPAGAILALSVAGGLAVAASEFLTVFSVHVVIASCADLAADPALADTCRETGAERHLYAFVVVGVAIVIMGAGASLGGSRPAAWALVALAVVVLAITLALDLPDAFSTGPIGERYEDAAARPGIGFWLAIAGALTALAAGVMRLRRPAGEPPPPRRATRGPLAERPWWRSGRGRGER